MWTQLPPEKGHTHRTQFLAHVYCGQMAGWMKTEDTAWYGSRPRPRPHCTGSQLPRKGHSSPLFSAHVYCCHGRPSQLLLSSCSLLYSSSQAQIQYVRIHASSSTTVASGQSNLTNRPHRRRIWTVQWYSPRGVSVHPQLIFASFGPLESKFPMASRSVEPSLHSSAVHIPYNGSSLSLKIVPFL